MCDLDKYVADYRHTEWSEGFLIVESAGHRKIVTTSGGTHTDIKKPASTSGIEFWTNQKRVHVNNNKPAGYPKDNQILEDLFKIC